MIYYFSGQGNSRAVAVALGKALGMEICRITRREVDNAPSAPPPTEDEVSLWVFPVHAWGVPRVVEEFIGRLAADTSEAGAWSVHHMVATCGDDIGRTDRLWAAMIRARGWRVGGVFSLTMPNTYVCLPGFDTDSAGIEAAKLDNAAADIAAIASRIADNRADGMRQVTPGSMPWAKSYILRPLFNAFLMSPRGFRVDRGKCNSCGVCASVCPMENISVDSHRYPQWKNDCTMCLACYHRCPHGAIAYRGFTRGKGRVHTSSDALVGR